LMIRLFLVLTSLNLLLLSLTCAIGYGVSFGYQWSAWHQLAGAVATLFCLAVHCTVFTYFAATAKWVKHAIMVKNLEPKLAERARSFKAQALPAALIAMSVVFAAAIVGVATLSYRIRPLPHHILALASLATNLICAWL